MKNLLLVFVFIGFAVGGSSYGADNGNGSGETTAAGKIWCQQQRDLCESFCSTSNFSLYMKCNMGCADAYNQCLRDYSLAPATGTGRGKIGPSGH